MDTKSNPDPKATFQTPAQRARRKIARSVAAMFDDIAREAGFDPAERRTAWAIITRLYERDDQPSDTPREVSLALIGKSLTSRSDDKEACEAAARRHGGHLFNHAQPENGVQLLTRYKAIENGAGHAYVDHSLPVAAFFSELLAEETDTILRDKKLDRKEKGIKIAEARARLVAEALTYLPKCDAEVFLPAVCDEDGETVSEEERYAYMPAPEAKAYCEKNPDYTLRVCAYTPPPAKEPEEKPFFRVDLDRIEEKIKNEIEKYLDSIAKRNSFGEARDFSTRLDTRIHKLLESWMKVAGAQREGEQKEFIHVSDLSGGTPHEPFVLVPEPERVPPDKLSGGSAGNPIENNDLQPPVFESVENFAGVATAADFYIRDGWAVVACCQFDPTTGLCTGPEKHQEDPEHPCRGKRPLIKGRKDAKPGDGYTAATRDRGLARDWFTRQFPDAGVAIRLDGHILIDVDVKDGARGLESYEVLSDTFNLPATLSAVTPSGGRHHIFKLPEGLPVDFLGSWTRILDSADLGGIDVKVDVRGLAHVEPSRGAAGVYCWIDPTAEIAELPRACCDYLHEVHEREQQKKLEKAQAARVSDCPQTFDPDDDQAKYFRDAPNGQRRPRLRSIACRLASGGASADQIISILHYHDGRFTEPTNDAKFIARVASGAVLKFGPEVSR